MAHVSMRGLKQGSQSVRAFVKLPLVGYLHFHRTLSTLPKDLLLELVQVVDLITTLDIQVWFHETKAPVARLSGIDGL